MTTKTIYVTIGDMKLGAMHKAGDLDVHVWQTDKPLSPVYLYSLDRFDNSKLTKKSLTNLFTQKEN